MTSKTLSKLLLMQMVNSVSSQMMHQLPQTFAQVTIHALKIKATVIMIMIVKEIWYVELIIVQLNLAMKVGQTAAWLLE